MMAEENTFFFTSDSFNIVLAAGVCNSRGSQPIPKQLRRVLSLQKELGLYVPLSDRAELHQPPDRVLVERVLAGRVVETGLHSVAVAQRAATVKHAWR